MFMSSSPSNYFGQGITNQEMRVLHYFSNDDGKPKKGRKCWLLFDKDTVFFFEIFDSNYFSFDTLR